MIPRCIDIPLVKTTSPEHTDDSAPLLSVEEIRAGFAL
jgi:hypothetical protein